MPMPVLAKLPKSPTANSARNCKNTMEIKKIGLIHQYKPRSKFDLFKAISDLLGLRILVLSLRQNSIKNKKGNVAISCIIGYRQAIQLDAFSKGETKPINIRKARFKGLVGTTCPNWRCNCTEFQILNFIWLKKLVHRRQRFTLRLNTERAPCESCSVVISEFLHYYSSAKMYVYHSEFEKNGSASRPTWLPLLNRRLTLSQTP
jgi:hypothetical protein